jgi:putative DNA primase/helicase
VQELEKVSIEEQLKKLGFTFEPSFDGQWHTVVDDVLGKIGYVAQEKSYQRILTFINFKNSLDYKTIIEWTKDAKNAKQKGENQKEALEFEALFKKREEERWQEAAAEALNRYSKAQTVSRSPSYFREKNIEVQGRIKCEDHPETAIFPITDVNGKIWSLQWIKFSKEKEFLAGGRLRGCFYRILPTENSKNAYIYICEGIATGFTINQATGGEVFCALMAHNLEAVARNVRQMYPSRVIIIAADNDAYIKENIGLKKGSFTATRVSGVLKYPKFKNPKEGLTDFNDLHVSEGIDKVVEQLSIEETEEAFEFVKELGHQDKSYFFTTSSNEQVTKVTDFSETDFLNLAPLDYWERTYGDEDEMGGIRLDWKRLKSTLMERSRKRGMHDPKNLRGAGVWRDGSKIVVHLGNRLWIDGKYKTLLSHDSEFVYTKYHSSPAPISEISATKDDLKLLQDIMSSLNYGHHSMCSFLNGWIATSFISGALDWRPHIAITGEAGSGKSTILESILNPLFGNAFFSDFALGGTSAAGIRQKLRQGCYPILIDENESEDQRTDNETQDIIRLARIASSNKEGEILKGTGDQVGLSYAVRFSLCIAGIAPKIIHGADRTRFTMIELKENSSKWEYLSGLISQITPEFSQRIFRHILNEAQNILDNQVALQKSISKTNRQRLGQQYGTLLAGDYALRFGGLITEEAIDEYISQLADETNYSVELSRESRDHEDCLNTMIQSFFRCQGEDKQILKSIYESVENEQIFNGSFEEHGLKIFDKDSKKFLFISAKHPSILRVMDKTKWSSNWALSLGRLEGAYKNSNIRISGRMTRGVSIPLDGIVKDKKSLEDAPF